MQCILLAIHKDRNMAHLETKAVHYHKLYVATPGEDICVRRIFSKDPRVSVSSPNTKSGSARHGLGRKRAPREVFGRLISPPK